MKKIYLFGAGSGSREVLLLLQRINANQPEWDVLGFVDEDTSIQGTVIDDLPVLPPSEIDAASDVYGVCGIMDPYIRQRMSEQLIEGNGIKLATLLAPDLVVPQDFAAGPGTIVMPSVTISFDVQLAKCVFVLWGAALGHHLRAGEYSTILSFASITGGCSVGPRSTIGAHATLNVNVNVGSDSMVGIGTTLLRNLGDRKQIVSLPRQIETDRPQSTDAN